MDQHPYFNVIAACLAAITFATLICLGTVTWFITEKARTAAVDRRTAREGERFRADLDQPLDLGPIKGDDGKWVL